MIYPVFFSVTLFGIYAHAKLTLFSAVARVDPRVGRSEEHTSELQSPCNLVCRLLLEKKKKNIKIVTRLRVVQTSVHSARLLTAACLYCEFFSLPPPRPLDHYPVLSHSQSRVALLVTD